MSTELAVMAVGVPMREGAQTDWEAIEAAYRAGVLSLREVARQHSLAVSTLHKRVRAKGWRRDLSPAVRQEAQSRLARELAPPADPEEQERGDRRIVDAAAATQVEVVRQHRNTLSRSRDIANRLLDDMREVRAVAPAQAQNGDAPPLR